MKKRLTIFLSTLLCFVLGAMAQTDVTSTYLTNADLSSGSGTGWTKTGNWTDNSGTANGTVYVSENYSGWDSQEQTNFALTQTVTLPAGLYKVEAYAFYNATVGNAKLSAVAGSTTLGSINVAVKGDISGTGNNDLQKAANSFNSSYNYLNTLYFEVASESSVTIGFTGTHDAYREWFVAGPMKLYRYDDNTVCTNSPLDFTTMIFNPSFEYGNTNGWTIASSSDTGARSTTNATYVMSDSDGSWLFNTWWKGNPITQTISNLPAGKYALSSVVASDGATIYLISGDDSDEYVYTETTASGTGIKLTKDFLLTSAATNYKIGVVGGADGTAGEHKAYREDGYWWYKCDDFTLTYKGNGVEHYATTQSGDAEADTWYAMNVEVAGTYQLTTNGTATIVYTQNPATLREAITTTASSGDDLELAVGTIFYKASAATTLSIAPASYSYEIGDATIDKTYVQPGQTVTVVFEATTNDQSTSLTQDYSGVTLGGSALTVTAGEKGFTFEVPATLAAGGEYTLAIPAGALKYGTKASSTAQTFTLKTTSVYDGTYFLRNEDGQYLSRGANWGTRAIVDDWGLPIVVTTGDDGNSTLKYADTGVYLYNSNWDAWCDSNDPANNNAKWTFTLNDGKYRLASIQQSGKYVKTDPGSPLIWTDGAESAVTNWTLEATSEHPAKMVALRTAMTTLSSEVSGLTSKTYLTSNPTAVTEQYQRNITENPAPDAFSESFKVYPGIYKFTIAAFHRMGSNDVTFPFHTVGADCPPMYAFFGDAKVQLKSVYDETRASAYTNDWQNYENGSNYPNGVDAALIAFQEGKYLNTIWVQVNEETTINYGIHYQGKSTAGGRWTCWATDGIEITRYYDPETDGLDEEDQFIESLRYTAGDFNSNGTIEEADVATLASILVGKTTEYNASIADVNGEDGVTLADLTQLVNVVKGTAEARVVDDTYKYATINATVYAEQSATENASGAGYTINSAKSVANKDVSDKYDMKDYLTTLNITTTLSNVKSVSVYAKGQENIAGVMTINVEDGVPTISYSAGSTPSAYVNSDRDDVNGKNMQSDVVTVTGTNAGTYTAYLLPLELSNGVTVTVRDSNGKYYSQDFDVTAGAENNLTFTATTATNNWMATIPGNVNFSMISTPGSHNSATSNTSSAAKCQSETIAQQLANGVRAFDIRPTYKYSSTITADNLYIFHGMVNTNVLYKDAIKTMAEFLQAHPTEAISVIMVKEDGTPWLGNWTDYTTEMCNAIDEIHSTYTDNIKMLDHSFYTLDDFRGKIFFGYRNAWDLHKTVRVTNWPDDSSKTDYSVGVGSTCSASVEDAYNTSGDSKKTVVNALLDLASANTDRSRFHITYTSVANSITSSANTQNPAAASYINGLTGPTGYVYADFMGSSSYSGATLLKAVIDQNYKYVFKGRSRVE